MPVAVVLTHIEEAPQLVRWAGHFARGGDGRIVLLWTPSEAGEPAERAITLGEASAEHPLKKTLKEAGESAWRGLLVEIREFAGGGAIESILSALDEAEADLLIVPRRQRQRGEAAVFSLEDQLFRRAPCQTMLLRCGPDSGRRCEKLLVAASGGPHAAQALRLAATVCDIGERRLTALYVEPRVGEDAQSLGRHILDRIVQKALGSSPARLDSQVVVADNVYAGIRSFPTDDYDLLIVGATQRGVVRRVLFGTVPARLMESSMGPALAVVRAPIPLSSRLRQAVDRWLQARVPQMEREGRLALFERLQSNSRWDFDFIAMLSLSTLIAALGLAQDSAAVVIGAMLVAPLMTPLIAAGLALVQGNLFMFRNAAASVIRGFVLAFALSAVVGLSIPGFVATPQMTARGSPGILDLLVAFFSGLAAAYAIGRPNLSSALPGVAIAAALVPPISTSGLALAIGENAMVSGAAFLFLTNIVAIVLGAACSLWAAGLRSGHMHGKSRSWVWRTALALLLLTGVLAIALHYRPF